MVLGFNEAPTEGIKDDEVIVELSKGEMNNLNELITKLAQCDIAGWGEGKL